MLRKTKIPEPASVLDLGGQDVNGTVHSLLPKGTLDVLDIKDGPGVTIVADATTWLSDRYYDLVISTEMLEHVSKPARVVRAAHGALSQGGWFIGTCASIGRRPHGACGEYDPPEGEFYRNVDPCELLLWLKEAGFTRRIDIAYQYDPSYPTTHDLYWRAEA